VVWAAVQYSVGRLLDGALQESAEVLYGVLETHINALRPLPGAVLPAPPHEENLVWQLVGPDQLVMLKSHAAPMTALLPAWKVGLSNTAEDWRVYGMQLSSGRFILYVAQEISDRTQIIVEATAVAALGTLFVGLLFSTVLRKQIRYELRHLRVLSRKLAQFDPLSSGRELPTATRAELRPIQLAVTELAHRLSRHVAQERAFAAHAAHALRTPLAGMDIQLAMALRECTPEVQGRLIRTREAAQRLTRVVTALITLFRSGAELKLQPVHLDQMLEHLPADLASVVVEADGPVLADPDLLAAACMNLLDNAVRYGARNVRIRVRSNAARQLLVFQDDGPGVSAEQRKSIQLALRSQNQESQKIGLGLMLTDMVARAHGGALRLLPSNHGFAICLVLKLKTPD
jgi:two-component system OmpR family sensor kinase